MKHTFLIYLLSVLAAMTIQSAQAGNLKVTSDNVASIYVDGRYTGKKTPATLELSSGEHVIGFGLDEARQYYRKTLNVTDSTGQLDIKDAKLVQPKIWKALFVGVPNSYGYIKGKKCTTHFTNEDLDHAYDFFKFNLQQQIEPYSYSTVKWQIERRDLTEPVELTYNPKNQWYTLEAEQGLAQLDNVKPGKYDTVFLFWREQDKQCSFKSGYFGLAWLDPTDNQTRQTGYVTVKFNPGDIGVAKTLQNYKNQDPGVWTHEWLHVVIEQFYPNMGIKVPIPPKEKLILHSAVAYGYRYPWMKWYKDLISGQVPLGQSFTGIGPKALLNCSIAQAATIGC